MHSSISQCKECNIFTLESTCTKCSNKTSNPLPPKFSPEDKYGKYRRMLKEQAN